ncbi:putative T7SS-secreted protein [Kutzneria sp. NPDC052558]|uniref:putative T7SS-secreted protein n=1 Tax=Kutzneria sp. NPDC052558 TaxID=3364121 RepID=UPI0037CAA12E
MPAELGETNNPKDLVPGNPGSLTSIYPAWRQYGDALHQAGAGLSRIDTTEGWSGPAGDAFRAKFEGQPGKWLEAGDCFHEAAAALERYATTLTWAQGQAAQAIQQWNTAEAATRQATDQHTRDEQTAGHQLPFNDPGAAGRQAAQQTLNAARAQLRSAGDGAAATIGAARDKAPEEPGFWSEVGDFFSDLGAGLANAAGTVVNAVASYGNAMIHHPLDTATTIAGAALTVVGAGGEVGGIALDATGAGAVLGVPTNIASAGVIATGMAMTAAGGGDLARHAAGDDEVEVMRTDHTGAEDEAFEPNDGFRGSEFNRDEIEEFINGHTGDSMPGMNRPSPQQVSEVLDKATPVRLPGQNAEEFVATVNGDKIRVIVNYDMPWRSTTYKIGQ